MARYRFVLDDGQMFESQKTPAQIRKSHPGAVITHRIEFDAVGNPQFVPFAGKQGDEDAADVAEAMDKAIESAQDFEDAMNEVGTETKKSPTKAKKVA